MKNKVSVLIAIDIFDQAGTGLIRQMEEAGFEVKINSTGHPLDYKKDAAFYENVDYVIAGLERYDSQFFDLFPQIKAISRVGVGVDSIDIKAALSKGIKVFKTSDKPSVAVAELCISNMIALLRHSFKMSETLKTGGWNPIQGKELRSCTVGIVGMGSIGKEVIKRLYGFNPKIIGTGRTWDAQFASEYQIERVSLEELMKLSDIVTIHLPYTSETEGIISRPLIKSMRKGSVLINTSRSGVIDNQALCESLRNDHLRGASIDVFSEHRSIKPYDDLENVILTPHIGSHTVETRKSMEAMSVDNLMIQYKLEHNASDEEAKSLFEYLIKHTVK